MFKLCKSFNVKFDDNLKDRFENIFKLCDSKCHCDCDGKTLKKLHCQGYKFFSHLYLKNISQSNLTTVMQKNVWDTLNMKCLGDYHSQYGQGNTLLLCNVSGKFQDRCM